MRFPRLFSRKETPFKRHWEQPVTAGNCPRLDIQLYRSCKARNSRWCLGGSIGFKASAQGFAALKSKPKTKAGGVTRGFAATSSPERKYLKKALYLQPQNNKTSPRVYLEAKHGDMGNKK